MQLNKKAETVMESAFLYYGAPEMINLGMDRVYFINLKTNMNQLQTISEQNNLALPLINDRVQVISDHGDHDLGLPPVHQRGL